MAKLLIKCALPYGAVKIVLRRKNKKAEAIKREKRLAAQKEAERQRIEAEKQRAEAERQRIEAERQRAEAERQKEIESYRIDQTFRIYE